MSDLKHDPEFKPRPAARARQRRTHEQQLARTLADQVRQRWGANLTAIGHEFATGEAAKALISVVSARAWNSRDCAGLFECWLQILADLGLSGDEGGS